MVRDTAAARGSRKAGEDENPRAAAAQRLMEASWAVNCGAQRSAACRNKVTMDSSKIPSVAADQSELAASAAEKVVVLKDAMRTRGVIRDTSANPRVAMAHRPLTAACG